MVTIANIKLICLRSAKSFSAEQVPAPAFPRQLVLLQEMLHTALSTRRPTPFPHTRDGWVCEAANHSGALTLRIHGPHGPLVTIGAATRTTHGLPLWRTLTALVPGQGLAVGTEAPRRIWCAWIWHEPPSAEHQDLVLCAAYDLACTWAAERNQWSRIYAANHARRPPTAPVALKSSGDFLTAAGQKTPHGDGLGRQD